MADVSPLDGKSLVAIALLSDRRETWSVISYSDLADKIGHVQLGMGPILDRVGAWCYNIGKQSLAMLVIGANGEPSEGMFRAFRGDYDPVTHENYESRRLRLWREDRSDVKLPTLPEDITRAYATVKG
jgi:hypothetical protein